MIGDRCRREVSADEINAIPSLRRRRSVTTEAMLLDERLRNLFVALGDGRSLLGVTRFHHGPSRGNPHQTETGKSDPAVTMRKLRGKGMSF